MRNYKKFRKPEEKDIRKLAAGKIPAWMQDKPIIIMHYPVKMTLGADVNWEWLLCYTPSGCDDITKNYPNASVVISRQDASMIIDANLMTVAHECRHGQIYEMPGNQFLETYKNYFSNKLN